MRAPQFFLIALMVLAADQLTKLWALHALPSAGSVSVVPGVLQFTLTSNSGAAFGLLQSATPYLALVALIAVVAIAYYVARNNRRLTRLTSVALALPLGGAAGNFVDRVWRRSVVDFVDAYVGTHHWPIFNVADAAICVGVAMLMLIMLRGNSQNPHPEAAATVSSGESAATLSEQSAAIRE